MLEEEMCDTEIETYEECSTPVDLLDKVIAELKDIQLWCKEHGLQKSPIVTQKIAYASAVREFLLTGNNVNQLGRLGTDKLIGDVIIYMLLEESNNKDLKRFIRKIDSVCFKDYFEYSMFRNNINRIKPAKIA